MEQQEIQTLINRCINYLSARGYTPNRIKEIQRLWTSGIVKFMNDSSKSVYTSDVGELFVQELIASEPTRPVLKEKLLSIRILNDMLENGEIRRRNWCHVQYELKGFLTTEMEKYLNHLKELRRSPKTLGDYRRILSGFQKHLQNRGLSRIVEIDEAAITSFVAAYPSNKTQVFHSVKTLFLYWASEHIINPSWLDFFKNYKVKQKERVYSFYTTDEAQVQHRTAIPSVGLA